MCSAAAAAAAIEAMAAGRGMERDLRMEARGDRWEEEAGPLAKGRGSV